MKLSFIIPCYNAASTLVNTVESVLKQDIPNYEILIINDGSTDETQKVAENMTSYNLNIFLYNTENRGVSSARNFGIERATGDYVLFLDADDTLDDGFYAGVEPYLDRNLDLIIFAFDQEKSATKIRHYITPTIKPFIADFFLGKVYVCMCSFLTNIRIIKNNNLRFDEGTHNSEDREFMLKVFLAAKQNFYYIAKELFHYKYREDSAIHQQEYNYKLSTGLDALERMLDMVKHNRENYNAALVQMKLTIILHYRKYLKRNCQDISLWSHLESYAEIYLPRKIEWHLNKYTIFVILFSTIYRINKKTFYKIISI